MAESNDFGYAVLGGFLVSLGTSIHLYAKGRTTGFNSMIFSIASCDKPSIFWKITFICSMIFTSGILWNSFGFSSLSGTSAFFDSVDTMVYGLSMFGFGLAGFFVGFGAKLSNGCTSGHLICGIPRRSARSMIAVVIYMFTAFITCVWRTESPFLDTTDYGWVDDTSYKASVNFVMGLAALIIIIFAIYFKCGKKMDEMFETIIISFVAGFLITAGMVFGGLSRRSKVLGFLNYYDATLIVFFVSVIIFNLLSFYYIIDKKHHAIIESPTDRITWRLIVGSIIYGFGWGLGALCPGPAIILFIFLTPHISIIWLVGLILGQVGVILFEKALDKIGNGSSADRLLNYE